MPIVPNPAVIELNDWLHGYTPDVDPTDLAADALHDVLNVQPVVTYRRSPFGGQVADSAVMQVRPGFARISDTPLDAESFYVRNVFRFNDMPHVGDHLRFIVCVLDNGTTQEIWVIDLIGTFAGGTQRIDDGSVDYNPNLDHWGEAIQGVWYGGQHGTPMYSWNPDTNTFNPDASNPNDLTLVDAVNAAVNTDTEYARDFAFKNRQQVEYSSKHFVPSGTGIRYDKWNDGDHYSFGDRVSFHPTDNWGASGSKSYWKSFKCIQAHKADLGANDPETDEGVWDFWQKVRLALPLDDDGAVTDDWNPVPVASKSGLGIFHGERLWLRWDAHTDDGGNPSRLQYSAPLKPGTKPAHGVDIADLTFDPTDFRPGDTNTGDGGGWVDFRSGDGDRVEALWSLGSYLIVVKRRTCWVVSGLDELTWTIRNIGNYGTAHPGARAICEHDGLVYFLGDQGLVETDGTTAELARGNPKIQRELRDRLQESMEDDARLNAKLWAFREFVYISIPATGRDAGTSWVYAYHPDSASFWKLSYPVLDAVVERNEGVDNVYFCAVPDYGDGLPIVYLMNQHPTTGDDARDDTGETEPALQGVPWLAETGWHSFNILREDRRVRRSWAVVRSEPEVTLDVFRNYDYSGGRETSASGSATRTTRVEGLTQDAHAIAFKVSGDEGPASLYGVAAMTEPRRVRYHRGSQGA